MVTHGIDQLGVQEPMMATTLKKSKYEHSDREYMKQHGFVPHYQLMQNVVGGSRNDGIRQ
jgi:hypothetical protein